jgi:hypothetical protein
MSSNQISLKPSYIIRVLGIMAFLLVLASTVLQVITRLTGHPYVFGLVRLFNLDAEQNIPSFFSTFLLLFADLFLWIITISKRKQRAPYASHWTLLAVGFFLMAADEASSVHELFARPIRTLLGNGNHGILYFAWIIPGILLVFVLALILLKFWLHLPSKTRYSFLIAAFIYIGGAIGFEMIGGSVFESSRGSTLYSVISTVEESLEMAGVIVFIWALLAYITENFKEIQFIIEPVHCKSTPGNPEA